MTNIEIGNHKIGAVESTFVIAEIGVNHNGDEQMARALIDIAKRTGADAVKFQSFNADRLVEINAATADYQKTNTGKGNQHDLLRELELSFDAHRRLMAYCNEVDIVFMSSPFDLESIDFLDELGVHAFKVPSPDCVSSQYLRHMGSKGRPVILSTGMCDMADVVYGIETLKAAGSGPVAALHCTSCYPAPVDQLNLLAMETMGRVTGVPIGYSDHSSGIAIPIAAVALGACIIEKHITLDRNLPGPDHSASIEEAEFEAMVAAIREVEKARGTVFKRPQPCEESARQLARRSLAVKRDLPAGHRLTREDLILMRPGDGFSPQIEDVLVGRVLSTAVQAYSLIKPEHLG
ncbi:N-acetylneuraminate synthase [Roseibium denhamense]|uniref:N-acetylneuraminate synthase n=1 Tax=Roseibium denhamense TaxID=76305 RepID=A0ABY1PMQ8_9HYPH|nr:N-acetylneuraminate synthase family protein [Roseibium denhamense]MTI03968.1 N-acetylneuraminate synthase [Roseibium denhamense]SMP37167.1 N-acetylneuraminate synthase [Roseibium denhamense]